MVVGDLHSGSYVPPIAVHGALNCQGDGKRKLGVRLALDDLSEDPCKTVTNPPKPFL
jgi:hypothetical protein